MPTPIRALLAASDHISVFDSDVTQDDLEDLLVRLSVRDVIHVATWWRRCVATRPDTPTHEILTLLRRGEGFVNDLGRDLPSEVLVMRDALGRDLCRAAGLR